MIDLTKKYTTKTGNEVILYEIYDGRVFGRVKCATGDWKSDSWGLFGVHSHHSYLNLVEVPKFHVSGFNQEQICKTITVYGQYMNVPVWTKYVFVSRSGNIFASLEKPELDSCGNWASTKMRVKVGSVDDIRGHIADSLVEV